MVLEQASSNAVPSSWYHGDILPLEMIQDQIEAMLERENQGIYQYCSCFCCSTKMLERRTRRQSQGESAANQSSHLLFERMVFQQDYPRQDRHLEENRELLNSNSIEDVLSSVFSSSEGDPYGIPSTITTTTRLYDHQQSNTPQQYNDLLHQEQQGNDNICRKTMCEWSYQIVDSLGFRREVVAIAFNYLDRFAVFQHIFHRITDYIYKLASITALYIALKVHNRTTIKASTLSSLSRGEITVGDIIAMESLMLDALSYHLCPPTCYTFISLFYAFVPVSIRESAGHPLMQHAIYQTELSVMDISFQTLKASHIALAAMLNVMEMMDEDVMPSWARSSFVSDVEECMLKASLQQEGTDVTSAVLDGTGAGTVEGDNGAATYGEDEKDNEEESDTSLPHHSRHHDKESLSRKLLWHSVNRARYLLKALMSREGRDFDLGTFISEQILRESNAISGNEFKEDNVIVPHLGTQVDENVTSSHPDGSSDNVYGIDAYSSSITNPSSSSDSYGAKSDTNR